MNDEEILKRAEEIKKEKAAKKKKEYNKEYVKNKTINKGIQLNKEHDADIIEFINGLNCSFNQFIKELIRKKIKEDRG